MCYRPEYRRRLAIDTARRKGGESLYEGRSWCEGVGGRTGGRSGGRFPVQKVGFAVHNLNANPAQTAWYFRDIVAFLNEHHDRINMCR